MRCGSLAFATAQKLIDNDLLKMANPIAVAMPVNTPEARQHGHELIGQMGPDQVAAVLQLLAVE